MNPEKKLQRKLRDKERAAKKRAKRLAVMTPEERKRHNEWHAAHAPSSKTGRAAERARREQAQGARERFSKPVERPADPAADDLAARRAELEQRRSWLEIEIATQLKQGVFG